MGRTEQTVAKISYYRQMRVDGAIRTGITVDDELVLHLFVNEPEEADPVLLWFVDIRCEGKSLPTGAEEARHWLLQQSAVVRKGLHDLADELRAGIDVDIWPLQRKVSGAPRGVRMTIVCSASRRLVARNIAGVLREVAEIWEESIRATQPLEEARQ
jgi:hypothetical protein